MIKFSRKNVKKSLFVYEGIKYGRIASLIERPFEMLSFEVTLTMLFHGSF
jgi:hypothetical protein